MSEQLNQQVNEQQFFAEDRADRAAQVGEIAFGGTKPHDLHSLDYSVTATPDQPSVEGQQQIAELTGNKPHLMDIRSMTDEQRATLRAIESRATATGNMTDEQLNVLYERNGLLTK